MPEHVKRRGRPAPGSIPEALEQFRAEVRFYREIAPVAGVRVPACYQAEDTAEGTLLVLEDLSAWRPGADPVPAARLLSGLHRRWQGQAGPRWPWLRAAGAAAGLIQRLYQETWPQLAARPELGPGARALGQRLAGPDRVVQAELAVGHAGPVTLVHGDASADNMRTGPDGEIALLDWEDVSALPGVTDLAWFLVSSVPPAQWDGVIAAYGEASEPAALDLVLPSASVQGLLSLADTEPGSADAMALAARLAEAGRRLAG
jgi:Phosphotransferase enzyme family